MDGNDKDGLRITNHTLLRETIGAEHMEANLPPCNAAVRLQARTRFLKSDEVTYGENYRILHSY